MKDFVKLAACAFIGLGLFSYTSCNKATKITYRDARTNEGLLALVNFVDNNLNYIRPDCPNAGTYTSPTVNPTTPKSAASGTAASGLLAVDSPGAGPSLRADQISSSKAFLDFVKSLPNGVSAVVQPKIHAPSQYGTQRADILFSYAATQTPAATTATQTVAAPLPTVPLCKEQYFAHAIFPGDPSMKPWVQGSIPSAAFPNTDVGALLDTKAWGGSDKDFATWLESAANWIDSKGDAQTFLYRSDKCLYYDQSAGQLVPAWSLSAAIGTPSTGRHTYEVLVVNGNVQKPIGHHMMEVTETEKAQVWKKDSTSKQLLTVDLNNMLGTGYLCSTNVSTRIPAGGQLSYSSNGQFIYDPSDPRFKEVSAYAGVSVMEDFYASKGMKNWSGSRIEVVITVDPEHLSAGPVYENPDIGQVLQPTIYIPDTLGTPPNQWILTNIASDLMASGHEKGHDVLFEFVQLSDDYEHKAFHEAFADWGVMVHYATACLCESICTGSTASSVCYSNQCLRSADNTIRYDGEEYASFGTAFHKKSQVITGLLWDLTKQGMSLDCTEDLLLETIHYLSSQTNFTELLAGMFTANQVLAKSNPSCSIDTSKLCTAMVNRGFSSIVPNSSCPGAGSANSSQGSLSDPANTGN